MAERPAAADPRPDQPPGQPPERISWSTWLWRTLLGIGGIVAVLRCMSWLAGTTREVPSSSEDTARQREAREAAGGLVHPSVRYEPRDVSFGWVVAILVLACGIASIHYYAIVRFFWSQEGALASQRRSASPLVTQPSTQLPPQPRLEQINRLENNRTSNVFLREAAKENVLQRYGPTEDQDFVHIPIQRAIQAVAGKLPVSKTPQPREGKGLLDGGESNSGRIYREGLR